NHPVNRTDAALTPWRPSRRSPAVKRVLTLWLTLLAVFWAARTALSVLLFARVDQSYEATLQLILVPALQAVALGWVPRRPGSAPLALPWRLAWARQRLVLALSAELIVLTVGWCATFGVLAPGSRLAPLLVLPAWSAAALLAAAAVLLARAAGRRGLPLAR